MKSLRRRAVAKVSGQRYVSYRDGGWELIDRYGSCGAIGGKLDDMMFLHMVKMRDVSCRVIEKINED
jgi:hypothetical protein